jgi:type II secretory pathway predicted ATPase ExeA
MSAIMPKLFNVAGPCIPAEHYLVPALARLPQLSGLIASKQFFVIHAARQSGKTTLLKALARDLTEKGTHVALYCSLETVQGIAEAEKGIPAIVNAVLNGLTWHPTFRHLPRPFVEHSAYTMEVNSLLVQLAQAAGKPLVVLFDEADCLSGSTLISFLRQLRDGYINRDMAPFPVSVALVGMRNIRDYKAKVRPDSDTLGSASPFNIVTKALTLTNFTPAEIAALYGQHTADTGQVFETAAIDRVSYWTCGQPWLVNALARECVEELLQNDYAQSVTAELMDEAAEVLLLRRDTHIDSLLERLKEPRVRRIVEPVILGSEPVESTLSDDCQYVLDLGLLKREDRTLKPANPIYAEVILRTLSYDTQDSMGRSIVNTPWISGDKLDMNGMLRAFQQFWRENSEVWQARYDYREAAPHIILQAFLQRVINGGGKIVREYALGRQRLDLLVYWHENRYALELKMKDQYRPDTAHTQMFGYLDRLGLSEGWMPVFDRNPALSWDAKLTWRTLEFEGKKIHVIGL